jgi:hypothetical protein
MRSVRVQLEDAEFARPRAKAERSGRSVDEITGGAIRGWLVEQDRSGEGARALLDQIRERSDLTEQEAERLASEEIRAMCHLT